MIALAGAALVAGAAQASINLPNVGDSVGHTLSFSDGVTANGDWAGSFTSITGSVERLANSFKYSYTFTVEDEPNISHLIIEASPLGTLLPFGHLAGDYFNPSLSVNGVQATTWTTSIGGHMTESNGNPGMPSNFYGIKIEDPNLEGNTWTLMFESLRVPVWGDFYGKGGNASYAFNEGFGSPDSDPADQVGLDHIPVPDSMRLLVVPEAASVATWLLLAMVGLCANQFWKSR